MNDARYQETCMDENESPILSESDQRESPDALFINPFCPPTNFDQEDVFSAESDPKPSSVNQLKDRVILLCGGAMLGLSLGLQIALHFATATQEYDTKVLFSWWMIPFLLVLLSILLLQSMFASRDHRHRPTKATRNRSSISFPTHD